MRPISGGDRMTARPFLASLMFLGTVVSAQTPAQPAAAPPASNAQASPAAPSASCPEMATALTALLGRDTRMRDWAEMARYRDANKTLAAPGSHGRARRLHGRLDHRWLATAALRRVLSRQAVRRSRDQRSDDAADAGALPPRRHRPAAEGGRDPCRHERHRRATRGR